MDERDCSCGICVKDKNCQKASGSVWDWDVCDCKSIYEHWCDYIMVCADGEEWSFDNCDCVEVSPTHSDPPVPVCPMDLCWDGSSRNATDCSCPSCADLRWVMDPCKEGQSWNYDSCRCEDVCMVKEAKCHRGYEWDERECDCLLLEKKDCGQESSCLKEDFGWHDEKCECVEKCDIVAKCYAGYRWDEYKCDCVLIEEPECGTLFATCHGGFVWNQDECSCVEQREPEICCMMACVEPGYKLDCATCSCVPVEEPEI